MMTIEKHYQIGNFSSKRTISKYEEMVEYVLQHLTEHPIEFLGGQVRDAAKVFATSINIDADKEKTIRFLRHTRDFCFAHFLQGTSPGKTVAFTIDGHSFQMEGQFKTAYMHTDMWLLGIQASIITRATDITKGFCLIPESAFINANVRPNKFDLSLIRFYKGLFDSSAHIIQLLSDAFEAANTTPLEGLRKKYVEDVLYPSLLLYRYILYNETKNFEQTLIAALQSHQKYWSVKSREDSAEGWVSIALLAACVIAIDDRGLTIPVKTDYMPDWLLHRNF